MKAVLFLVTPALSLLIAGFYLARSQDTPAVPAAVAHAAIPPMASPPSGAKENPWPAITPSAIAVVVAPRAYPVEPDPTIIPQSAADFATGQAYNLVAGENSLRLASDAPVLPGLGQAVGVYVSPIREIKTPKQQQEESFDTIHFDYDIAAGGGVVKFEFRTIAVDEEGEGWSAWREIPPEDRNAPITLERTAEKWQYRVLLAHEPGGSSEIRDITVVTQQDPAKAAHLFNYGTP